MMQATQTVISTAAASAPTWWDKAAALSTVAVAILAGVEIVRAIVARQDQRRAADARAAALAFALWQQLQRWLASTRADHYLAWGKDTVLPEYPPVERRFLELMAEAEASAPVRRASEEALGKFFAAYHLLHGAQHGYKGDEEPMQAKPLMKAAAEALKKAMSPALRALAQ